MFGPDKTPNPNKPVHIPIIKAEDINIVAVPSISAPSHWKMFVRENSAGDVLISLMPRPPFR